MCLIITGPAAKVRQTLLTTPGLLRDIYQSNKDGIGAMFTTDDGAMNVTKTLPKNVDEAAEFIERLPENDRDVALHFRMRTHGDVDLTNCHPYPVVDGQVHLMHNGVIHHVDDSSDKTKSDTWHYIDQVLRPQIEAAPQIMNVPAWQQLVADDIGTNNKFVLLDKDGKLLVLNKRTGLEYDGMWFSNTYAWTPKLLIPDYRWTGGGAWGGDDDDRWANGFNYTSTGSNATARTLNFKPVIDRDELWGAVAYGDADGVYTLLKNYPISTLYVLFEHDEFVCSVAAKDLAAQDAHIVKLLEDGNQERIAKYARKSDTRCRKVAEVIAWYGDWVSNGKSHTAAVMAAEHNGDQLVIDGVDTDSHAEATHEVVDGKVVPIRAAQPELDVDAEDPDEADLTTFRKDFQDWMVRQGYMDKKQQKAAALLKPSPFPTTATNPPAKVAKIGARHFSYRGYQVEVSDELFTGPIDKLRDHLESEAQRMHDEDLAKTMQQAQAEAAIEPPLHEAHEVDQHLGIEPARDEALNDMYSG